MGNRYKLHEKLGLNMQNLANGQELNSTECEYCS